MGENAVAPPAVPQLGGRPLVSAPSLHWHADLFAPVRPTRLSELRRIVFSGHNLQYVCPSSSWK